MSSADNAILLGSILGTTQAVLAVGVLVAAAWQFRRPERPLGPTVKSLWVSAGLGLLLALGAALRLTASAPIGSWRWSQTAVTVCCLVAASVLSALLARRRQHGKKGEP